MPDVYSLCPRLAEVNDEVRLFVFRSNWARVESEKKGQRAMTRKMKLFSALLASAIGAGVACGDTLQLSDGSVIKGTIESAADGKVTIKTEFAGTLTIDQSLITGMNTDGELHFAFESGDVLVGRAAATGGTLQVTTEHGPVTVPQEQLTAVWKPGEKSPLEPEPPAERKWKYELRASLSGKTGNTESSSISGGFTGTLAGEGDTLKIYATGERSEENDNKTADELTGGIDYESMMTDRQSWYVRTQLETDEIELLALRTPAAVGLGHYFLKDAGHELRVRLGLMYVNGAYMEGAGIDDTSSPGLDAGLYHMWKINDRYKLVNEVTYTPTFEDFHDYQVDHTSSLDFPISGAEAWSLRLSVSHDYSSRPAANTERLDTTYSTELVLSF